MSTAKKKFKSAAGKDARSSVISMSQYKTEFVVGDKGGTFELPGGGSFMEIDTFSCKKKVTVSTLLVFPTRNKAYFPPISRYEKLSGHVFHFTCKGTFSQPVKISVPFRNVAQFAYGMSQLNSADAWTRIEVKKYLSDKVVFEIDQPRGFFAVLSEFPHEEFTISKDGGLYYFRNARYCTLQVPKASISEDLNCVLRIRPVQDEIFNDLRNDFDFIKDIKFISPFYDFGCHKNFKRSLTLKIPLPNWSVDVDRLSEKALIVCKTDDRWFIHECSIKFTGATVSFRTTYLGVFCIVIPRYQKALRPDVSMNTLYYGSLCVRVELLGFIAKRANLWQIWIGCVRSSEVKSLKQKYFMCGFDELITVKSEDPLEGPQLKKDQNSLAVNIKQMQQDLGFGDEENVSKYIYGYDGMEIKIKMSGDMETGTSSAKKSFVDTVEKVVNIPSNSCQNLPSVNADMCENEREDYAASFYFFTESNDCYQCFEVKPNDELEERAKTYLNKFSKAIQESDDPSQVSEVTDSQANTSDTSVVSVTNENNVQLNLGKYVKGDQKIKKSLREECMKRFDSLPVDDRFYAKFSCSVHTPGNQSYLLTTFQCNPGLEDVLLYFGVGLSDKASYRRWEFSRGTRYRGRLKSARDKERIKNGLISDVSLKTLSQQFTAGLQLGMYLNLPESIITDIGCEAIKEHGSLEGISLRVLIAWKNIVVEKGKSVGEICDQLIDAFIKIGREDIACTLQLHFATNTEMTSLSFQ